MWTLNSANKRAYNNQEFTLFPIGVHVLGKIPNLNINYARNLKIARKLKGAPSLYGANYRHFFPKMKSKLEVCPWLVLTENNT